MRDAPAPWSMASMKGVEIVADQAYFRGSTAELQRALLGGALDRCGSLVVEGKLTAVPAEIGRLIVLNTTNG